MVSGEITNEGAAILAHQGITWIAKSESPSPETAPTTVPINANNALPAITAW